jgi:cytochrome d ubiquinol oxidase subunit II
MMMTKILPPKAKYPSLAHRIKFGFFILEGFDFGVGMLLPFLGRGETKEETDLKRRVILNTIGPFWDGNEVWLLTAGGATFAAFPLWYATMFSGFYLPFLFLLVALIMRGIAIEFRSKDENPKWRKLWDWSIFTGSLISPLLLGIAFANLARGVPIDANMNYVGGFWYLLNPYALLGGITTVAIFALHGAIFLSMKTTDDLRESAQRAARRLWIPAVITLLLLLVATYMYFMRRNRFGWAFGMTAITIAFSLTTFFLMLYPDVMISTLDPAYSLTIYNASSGPYTLRIMTILDLLGLPKTH